jgi:hypothetical protein
MDKVVLDGIEYVKASAAAKQFRYTSDYVGQLCRAKKVDARLVGRTWFVNPESLKEHKNTTHHKTPDSEIEFTGNDDLASNVKINRIDVNAPLKNKTAKSTIFHTSDNITTNRLDTDSSPAISYHKDAETLLPDLKEKTQSNQDADSQKHPTVKKFLHIEPASAKKLKISSDKQKQVSFTPTALPNVALSGKLSVAAYQDQKIVTESVTEPVSKEFVADGEPSSKPITPVSELSSATTALSVPKELEDPSALPVPPPSLGLRLLPLTCTLLAIVVSFLLLTIVSEVTVTQMTSTSNMSFELEYFTALFAQ